MPNPDQSYAGRPHGTRHQRQHVLAATSRGAIADPDLRNGPVTCHVIDASGGVVAFGKSVADAYGMLSPGLTAYKTRTGEAIGGRGVVALDKNGKTERRNTLSNRTDAERKQDRAARRAKEAEKRAAGLAARRAASYERRMAAQKKKDEAKKAKSAEKQRKGKG